MHRFYKVSRMFIFSIKMFKVLLYCIILFLQSIAVKINGEPALDWKNVLLELEKELETIER